MKKVFLYHILPFSIAVACGLSYVFFVAVKNGIPPKAESTANTFTFPAYIATYEKGYEAEKAVFTSLKNGSPLVIMGSSELSNTTYTAIPYTFFKALGVGHAGNQSFCMFSQLCAMSPALKNAKMVIIVSPGWFCEWAEYGTSVHSFLEFNDMCLLYNTYYNSQLPVKYKAYISKYIADNMHNIESPTAILNAFYYDYLSGKSILNRAEYTVYRNYYHMYCRNEISCFEEAAQKKQIPCNELLAFCNDTANAPGLKMPDLPRTINWNSLSLKAAKEFADSSTNNKLGIQNEYYTKWIKGKPAKHLQIADTALNTELKDFKMLLSLLRLYNTDVYFIIQPLNPYYYNNLKELQPTINEIKKAISAEKYGCCDMFVADTAQYTRGILNDIMHLGNVGWYKADSAIYEHFYGRKHE